MRLAFVSPLPPAPTGVADYAADVLALLAPEHELEAFHDQDTLDAARLPPSVLVRRAGELPARHAARPFDVVVHQLGNGPAHDFVYDLVSRVPGLTVLHDLVLFHARAAMFVDSEPVRRWRREADSPAAQAAAAPVLEAWRAELGYTYPEAGERLFAVHLGTVGDVLPYAYPLLRIPVEASRAVAVHSNHAADVVRREVPDAEVAVIPQPVATRAVEPGAVGGLRARLGFANGDVVVGCYGLLTREKRIEAVARAVARAAESEPRLRLLLAGPVPDPPALERLLSAAGVAGRTVVTGRLPHEELATHVAVADVVVHLRWPTTRETSAALLRVLAQGRPTIVSDLLHQSDLPADAVRRIDVAHEEELAPVLLALASDPGERSRLGAAAARHVAVAHSPARVLDGWRQALALARRRPDPAPRPWPAHWARPQSRERAPG